MPPGHGPTVRIDCGSSVDQKFVVGVAVGGEKDEVVVGGGTRVASMLACAHAPACSNRALNAARCSEAPKSFAVSRVINIKFGYGNEWG